MGNSVASMALVLAAAGLLMTATPVLAHGAGGEEALEVEPASVTAGQTVVLAGSGLEPDSDRVLLMAGADVVLEFGTVTTDAEGMFQKEILIPGHLPSGIYELRAIGDETLSTTLEVTAAGQEAVAAVDTSSGTAEELVARQRSPIEIGSIILFVALTAVLGVLLVWRAERFRGAAS